MFSFVSTSRIRRIAQDAERYAIEHCEEGKDPFAMAIVVFRRNNVFRLEAIPNWQYTDYVDNGIDGDIICLAHQVPGMSDQELMQLF